MYQTQFKDEFNKKGGKQKMEYDITYGCGHEGVVNLVGKTKDREYKLEWYKNFGDCPECYEEKQKQKRQEEELKKTRTKRKS